MELSEAQNILRDYMAPRSHAINVFAQTGKLHVSIDLYVPRNDADEYAKEMLADAKQELIEAIVAEALEQHKQARYHETIAYRYNLWGAESEKDEIPGLRTDIMYVTHYLIHNESEAMEYLLKDSNLDVPCSRYGKDTE